MATLAVHTQQMKAARRRSAPVFLSPFPQVLPDYSRCYFV